jgi:acyl transferase domain-containing protein/NADPH:quinone reductase-like Zn-dependent oxidoreductase/NAD(P)-dependent dehydrogenase (short-subunit alcohol dehydrogenase family)
MSSTMAPETMTPLKRAFLALEDAEARLAARQHADREPIAVVGLGCRVPGNGDDPASFWRLMHEGVDAITSVPADRWDHDAFYDPDPGAPGRIATRSGGFLRTIDTFDATLFGIAPREAEGMDPQQRLLLEVAWEALEHAGQAPDRLQESDAGVYIGVCSSDYAYLQVKSGDRGLLDAHFTSGIAHSVFSGRLSYLLGLRGPSLTIDTACSSSLVAVHLACQGLRNGECSLAIAGGANLILAPDLFIALSHSRMLAPDGRCKTFDAAADGFARSEGCGVVILKRLSRAQADGDRILALIRGSAINQDGPSSSLTAPNGPAQEAVIRAALAFAGIAPREVGFIEAHGTGTQLGDPLEVKALGAVFGGRDQPLIIGSVKTNIGHLEAAAGISGLIKVVLSLQHRTIPPHLHFETPSPHIAWQDLPFVVPRQPVPWQPINGRRIGGVSSFGFSGTNAHVVLEEAPAKLGSAEANPGRSCYLFALSARDPAALAQLAGRHAAALAGPRNDTLADVCHTANVGRAHFAERATIVTGTVDRLRACLEALSRGEDAEGLMLERGAHREPPRIVFLFTGQGAQYAGMTSGLYDASPVFRATLDRCAEILRPYLDRPLLDVLFTKDTGAAQINQTVYTQPALFAVEFALTELWRSWGVTPAAVIGHSVGEYVAACVAGVFSLQDGLRLIALRGQLMQSLPCGGEMAAVFAPEALVAPMIAPHVAVLSIAGANGPSQTVISGDAAAVEDVCRRLEQQGVQSHALPVSHAFHSPLVDPVLDQFEQAARSVRFAAPRIRLISNLTGRQAVADEITRPSYWRRHMREAVRFGDGLRALAGARPDCCIEIGPHPALLPLAGAALTASPPRLIASLRRGKPDWQHVLEGLSAVYRAGAKVDWRGLSETGKDRIVDLPHYPFQRERYWFQVRTETSPRAAPSRPGSHALLGARLRSAMADAIYEATLSADAPGFVRQHRVLDHVILPATAYLEMLVAGARDVLRTEAVRIEDVTISEAMLLADDGAARIVQTVFEADHGGTASVSISSVAETPADAAPWVRHAAAQFSVGTPSPASSETLSELRAQCPWPVAVPEFYDGFKKRGMRFGDDFYTVRQVWRGANRAVGEIALSAASEMQKAGYTLHPLLLDGCLQLLAAALPTEAPETLYLPVGFGSYLLYGEAGERCWSHVAVQPIAEDFCRADVLVFDADGAPVAELRQIRLKRVTRGALERIGERWLDGCLYQTQWRPADIVPENSDRGDPAGAHPVSADRSKPREWLVFADRGGVAAGLAALKQAQGDRCTLVYPGPYTRGPEGFKIDPAKADDYRRLLLEIRAGGRAVDGVLHAWSLDSSAWDGTTDADLAEAQLCSAISPLLLAQALAAEASPPLLRIVTRGGQQADGSERSVSPAQAAAWGLGRSVALEHPELNCVCIDLDPGPHSTEVEALVAELAPTGMEGQVALRAAGRRVARLVRTPRAGEPQTAAATQPAWRLVPAFTGTFERFHQQSLVRRPPAFGEVEIAVQATGINFKDVLQVLGMGSGGDTLIIGGECAGRVTSVGPGVSHLRAGDDVMAVGPGCLASFVTLPADLVQLRPPTMSAEEAAAFPIAFLTAEFCLSHVGKMQAGDRVLIHAGAGGVGMAAIRLAQLAGAEVFATAGSEWKRGLLRSIGVPHVLSSRDISFAQEVMARTGGRGVDLVLNALTGDLMEAGFGVLARGGRFIEIGKRDLKSAEWVAALGRDVAYSIVDWSEDAAKRPALIGAMLVRLIDRLRQGLLTSLPRQVFALEDAPRAFRLMSQARHVGKIVLRHGPPTPLAIRPDGTYLVTGGLSGLGLLVAQWLGERKAGRLVLIGRRGVTPEAAAVIDQLRSCGTEVMAEAVDVTDEAALGHLLTRIRAGGPPLRGVVHCAGIVDDAGLLQQDASGLLRVLAPKVRGGWLLDRLTRADPLDCFVLFASAAGVLGSPGQSNYAAANAVLDQLAQERRNRGLCALSIDWGAWADVGMAAERALAERLAASGLDALTPVEGIAALERLLQGGAAQVSVLRMDWQRYAAQSGAAASRSFLADILGVDGQRSASATSVPVPAGDLRRQFEDAPPLRRRSTVARFVNDCALLVLGMASGKPIDPSMPLGDLGLDSLLAVELRNTLSAAVGQSLSATLLFDYPTIDAISDYFVNDILRLAEDDGRVPNDTETIAEFDLVGSVEELSDDDVDRALAARIRNDV